MKKLLNKLIVQTKCLVLSTSLAIFPSGPLIQIEADECLAPRSGIQDEMDISAPHNNTVNEKVAKKKIQSAVLKLLRSEEMTQEEREDISYQTTISNKNGTISFGLVPKMGPYPREIQGKIIQIQCRAEFKEGMKIEIAARFDDEGVLILDLYELDKGKLGRKLPMTPRFDAGKKGFFNNSWGKEKSEMETLGQGKVRNMVIKLLLNEEITQEAIEGISYQTTVKGKSGVLFFGTVPKIEPYPREIQGKIIQILSRTEFKEGMKIEIAARFDEEGVLILDLYELEDKGGEKKRGRKLPLSPRFDAEKRGFFNNSWGKEKSEEETLGQGKVRDRVLTLLRGEEMTQEEREGCSYQTTVKGKNGSISFGTIPKTGPYPKEIQRKGIQIQSKAVLKEGMEVEIAAQFDEEGGVILDLYELEVKGGEKKRGRKLPLSPRFDAEKTGFFKNSGRKEKSEEEVLAQVKVRDLVLKLLRDVEMTQEEREGFSYQITVKSKHGTISFGTIPKIGPYPREIQGKQIKIQSIAELKERMEIEIVGWFDEEGILAFDLYELEDKGGEKKRGRKLPLSPRFDAGKTGFFNNSWEKEKKEKSEEETLGQRRMKDLVLKLLRREQIVKEEREGFSYQTTVTSKHGTLSFGTTPKMKPYPIEIQGKPIQIQSAAEFKEGMEVEIAARFDEEGVLILDIYELENKGGEKKRGRKLPLTPRFDAGKNGFFNNSWGKEKSEMEALGQGKVRDRVLTLLREEQIDQKEREGCSYQTTLKSKNGTISFGTVPKRGPIPREIQGKPIQIQSKAELKDGMEVEIAAQFDEEGVLILDLYELKDKGGEKMRSRKLPLSPRFDAEKRGFFNNSWGKEKSEEETLGQGKVRERVLKLLREEQIDQKEREGFSYQTTLKSKDGIIFFGTVPKRGPIPREIQGKPIQIQSKAELKDGMEVEIAAQFDEEGVLILDLYELKDKGGEKMRSRKLPLSPRFDAKKTGFFNNSFSLAFLLDKKEILKLLEASNWNIGNVKEKIGIQPTTDLFEFFKQKDLLGELESKIIERFEAREGRLSVMATDFGISNPTLAKLIKKLLKGQSIEDHLQKSPAHDKAKKTIDKFKDQGILQVILCYGLEPEVLQEIVSLLGEDNQVSFEELQHMIGAFRKYMNLEEVTMFHGFPPLSQTDKTEVFFKTMIEKAFLLEQRDEGQQEVLIRAYLRFIYRKFSKDAEGELDIFNKEIDKAITEKPDNKFLKRFKERVNEEFTKAMAFTPTYFRQQLKNHQRIGAYRLSKNNRFALLDGTRVGKTRQVLAAMDLSKKTLIVSPANLIDIWGEEEAKSFEKSLNFAYLGEENSREERELALEKIKKSKHVSVVLQGGHQYRRQLLKNLRQRKNGIIHISMETLRRLNKEELAMLQKGLNAVVVDEWQYVERYLGQNAKAHSLQGNAIQQINPPVKWLLSASPFGTDPYKLYSLFHYLMKDDKDPPPDWAMNARVFRKVFTESISGFRDLSAKLARVSLRRESKDVFDGFDPEISAEQQPFSIPEPMLKPDDKDNTGNYQLTRPISEAAISMIENFRTYIADVYNPFVMEEREKGIEREPSLKLIAQEDLNILTKVNFLNWLMVKPDRVGLREESPFWDALDEILIGKKGRLKDKNHKVLIYAQNIFMVQALIDHFEKAGYPCARIDGTVTGWAKDPKDKTKILTGYFDDEERFHPGKGDAPIRAKSWERHRFQEDENVQICVANIRAGVGLDLSRGDTVIYAQPPRTFTEYYQSRARVLGFNPRHVRSQVEIIHMTAQYPEYLLQELDQTPQGRFVRKGTITEIQLNERLVGQKEQFRMIIEGIDQEQLNNAGLSLARLMPGVLEDESLDINGLSPKRRMLQESVQKLVRVCYASGPEIKRAIYKIVRAANDAKADLTGMSESILCNPDFNVQDMLHIADIADVASHSLQRKLYDLVGEALDTVHERGESLSDYAEYWQEGEHLKTVPGYLLVALLASGICKDGVTPPRVIEGLIDEIRASNDSNRLFQQLTEAILILQNTTIPHDRYFLQTGISLKERINLLKSIADLARAFNGDLQTILKEDPGTFKKYKQVVDEKRFGLLRNFLNEEIDKTISIRALRNLEMNWGTLEPIFMFLRTLKRGDEESLISEEAGLIPGTMKRDIKRFAEIIYHIAAGDYPDWRNRQQGEREFGLKVGFLEEEKKFWRKWTEELLLNKRCPGWGFLSQLEITKSHLLTQAWQDLQTMVDSIREPKKIRRLDGREVAELVEKALQEDLVHAVTKYEAIRKQLGIIRNAVLKSETLSNDQKKLLLELNIDLKGKPSELLDRVDRQLSIFVRVADWLTIISIENAPQGDEAVLKACERIQKRMELQSAFGGKLLQDFRETLEELGNGKNGKSFSDVEIEITSDPQKILCRGMLSPYLMNCFQLEGDWRLNRGLIDDLGSRNKMLVIVKAEGRPQAVAIAKIKKTEDGTPVVFLEKILHIKGSYDFRAQILAALAIKVQNLSEGTLLADTWRKQGENPAIEDIKVYSTGGYGEDEYSEAHHKIRKNNYKEREYEFWNMATLILLNIPKAKEEINQLGDECLSNQFLESAA